jgi:hypothetical protein
MSESHQHHRVTQVSTDDQPLIGEIQNSTAEGIGFKKTQQKIIQAQEVLLWVEQYTESAELAQRVCVHPAKKIKLKNEIM